MNLKQLRNRLWWTIGDNPDNPLLISRTLATELINDGLRDLAEVLRRETTSELSIDLNGVATLPSDFVSPVRVTWDDNEINPVEWHQKPPRGGVVAQYSLPNLRTIQLHDAPLVEGVLRVTYLAYAPELEEDDDVPSDIPPEYHEGLATIYARAQYAKNLGYMDQYRELSHLWENIKYKIGSEIEARTSPVNFDGRWNW